MGIEVSELRILTRSYEIKILPVKEVPQLFLTECYVIKKYLTSK